MKRIVDMNNNEITEEFRAFTIQNDQFWKTQHDLMEKRLSNEHFLAEAIQTVNSTKESVLPTYHKTTFEAALENAEKSYDKHTKAFASHGGKAKKEDSLQSFILDVVRQNPTVTEPELRRQISAVRGHGLINDIEDGLISFNSHDGKVHDVPCTGLKDRLSRAKKTWLALSR